MLGKDLAVDARRRRVYLLRFFYVAMLTGLAYLAWGQFGSVRAGGTTLAIRAQFADAGLRFVLMVLRVQFFAMAFLAASVKFPLAGRPIGLARMLELLGVSVLGYGLVGVGCFWRATKRFRRVAFEGSFQ